MFADQEAAVTRKEGKPQLPACDGVAAAVASAGPYAEHAAIILILELSRRSVALRPGLSPNDPGRSPLRRSADCRRRVCVALRVRKVGIAIPWPGRGDHV